MKKGITITFQFVLALIVFASLMILVVVVFTQANIAHMGPKTICTLTATTKSLIVNIAGGWQNLPIIRNVVAGIPVVCPVYRTNPLSPIITSQEEFKQVFGQDLVDCWQQYGEGKYSPLWGIKNPKLCAQIPYEFEEELPIKEVGTYLKTRQYSQSQPEKTYDDLLGEEALKVCRIPPEIKKSEIEEFSEALCEINPLCVISSGFIDWMSVHFIGGQEVPCSQGIPAQKCEGVECQEYSNRDDCLDNGCEWNPENDFSLNPPQTIQDLREVDPRFSDLSDQDTDTLTKGTVYVSYYDYQGFLEHASGYGKRWTLCKNDQQELGAFVFQEGDALVVCVDDEIMRSTVPEEARQ